MPPQAALKPYGVGVERTHAHAHTTIATQTMTDTTPYVVAELVTDLSGIRNSLSRIESVVWDGTTRQQMGAMDGLRHNILVLNDIIESLRTYGILN